MSDYDLRIPYFSSTLYYNLLYYIILTYIILYYLLSYFVRAVITILNTTKSLKLYKYPI
jgi:hypothetical protein